MSSRPLLATLFALAVAACGGSTSSGPTSTATPATSAAPATPAAPAAEAPASPTGAGAAKRPTAPGPNQTADGVVFNFKPDGTSKGKKIYLAGNFNDWKPSNPQYLMTDDGSGTFSITVKLPPGTYQYKYVLDGTTWVKDPYSPGDAPDGFGGRNGQFDVK